jgi:hypothetical protein
MFVSVLLGGGFFPEGERGFVFNRDFSFPHNT